MPTELQGREAQAKTRDLGLDLIRGVAALLVVSVHFFLNCGYYYVPMVGKKMFLMTVLRTGAMACVPLFLLLSGCLCRNKKLSGRYYLGLVRILLTYLLASVVCIAFRCLYVKDVAFSLRWAAGQVLSFGGAPYSWYIEMYIGLFLLIPFLNVLWSALASRRQKEVLVLTLLALTTLPAMTNARWHLLPSWWMDLYPLAYYFLGAYLGEVRPRIRWRWGLPALAAAVLAGGAYVFWLCHGQVFQWGDYSGNFAPATLITAVLVFLLLRELPLERLPGWCKWLTGKASELSLGIYLLSWCFDRLFHIPLAERIPAVADRVAWFPVLVPAVFLCSALAAQVLEWVRRGITRLLGNVIPALR